MRLSGFIFYVVFVLLSEILNFVCLYTCSYVSVCGETCVVGFCAMKHLKHLQSCFSYDSSVLVETMIDWTRNHVNDISKVYIYFTVIYIENVDLGTLNPVRT